MVIGVDGLRGRHVPSRVEWALDYGLARATTHHPCMEVKSAKENQTIWCHANVEGATLVSLVLFLAPQGIGSFLGLEGMCLSCTLQKYEYCIKVLYFVVAIYMAEIDFECDTTGLAPCS